MILDRWTFKDLALTTAHASDAVLYLTKEVQSRGELQTEAMIQGLGAINACISNLQELLKGVLVADNVEHGLGDPKVC